MKYKLVKLYPNSPPLGTIIHSKPNYNKYCWAKFEFISRDNVEIYNGEPYYFVTERLNIVPNVSKGMRSIGESKTCFHSLTNASNYTRNKKIFDNLLKYPITKTNAYSLGKDWKVIGTNWGYSTSIERIIDKKMFSIGDKVIVNSKDRIIDSFQEIDNELVVHLLPTRSKEEDYCGNNRILLRNLMGNRQNTSINKELLNDYKCLSINDLKEYLEDIGEENKIALLKIIENRFNNDKKG